MGALAPQLFGSTFTIPSLFFYDFVFFVPWLFEPSWPGTGPFSPRIGPFHRILVDHEENATIHYRVWVWMDSSPPTSDPPLPSAPLHRSSANRAHSTPGIELGRLDLPSLRPHPPLFLHGRHRRRGPPPRAIQEHHGLPLRPKTFVGSNSAHEIAIESLAISGNGAVHNGAPPGSAFRPPFVLSIAHHWRLRFPS